ncbi:MAG: phosphoglucomutase/phosphomannomutase family protein [Deltaproteobacteria bacterium]|nr:phosphoglucomutase/phosphomannomutase family protein [Deltaproteobacteria bacterium]
MIKFGTDGWRAIIHEDFNEQNVRRVAHALAEYLLARKKKGLIYVGFDRRLLSEESAGQVAEVLTANGFLVRLSKNYCPTPVVAWQTKTNQAIAGVMITASHNPPQWNGIKIKEEDGGAASPEYTAAIEEILNSLTDREVKQIPLKEARAKGLLEIFDPMEGYIQALQKRFATDEIRKANWKIGFDPLYGAGTDYLGKILETDIFQIHGEKDPNFGGLNPEPIRKNLSEMIRVVRDKKLDLALSTDGDADRIGAVDEEGNFVDSHHIFALILRHLASVHKKTGLVVKTITTTNMIDKLAKRYHLRLLETPVGFKHLGGKLRAAPDPLMGGEESGGIAVTDWLNERDGIFSALFLLDIITYHRKKLSSVIEDLHREIGPHYFERLDLHLGEEVMKRLRETLPRLKRDRLGGQTVSEIKTFDGTKFLLSDGSWLLIRASGTEPLLRLYAESSTPDQVKRLLEEGQALLC